MVARQRDTCISIWHGLGMCTWAMHAHGHMGGLRDVRSMERFISIIKNHIYKTRCRNEKIKNKQENNFNLLDWLVCLNLARPSTWSCRSKLWNLNIFQPARFKQNSQSARPDPLYRRVQYCFNCISVSNRHLDQVICLYNIIGDRTQTYESLYQTG